MADLNTSGELSRLLSNKRYEAGGGQSALDDAVQKWKDKNKYTEFDRIPGHVLDQLRREIESKGKERLRRFESAEPRKLKRRQNAALELLAKYGITGEEAEKVINLRINPEKVAKQHVDRNDLKLVTSDVPATETSVPDPAPAPVVPVGENNADSEPLAGAPPTPDEPVETAPVQADAITPPQTNRQLMVAEAKRKYKDSPFKQWAHANQKLAMAVRPGQAGYAQVQEYLKESGLLKTKDLQIKPNKGKNEDSYLNIQQLQFNPASQGTGIDGLTGKQRRFILNRQRSQQVDTPGLGVAMVDPQRGYTG